MSGTLQTLALPEPIIDALSKRHNDVTTEIPHAMDVFLTMCALDDQAREARRKFGGDQQMDPWWGVDTAPGGYGAAVSVWLDNKVVNRLETLGNTRSRGLHQTIRDGLWTWINHGFQDPPPDR